MVEHHQLKRSEATLTQREAVNVINSTKNFRDRCITKCLYFGGMRVAELDPDRFLVEHLDFGRRVIHVMRSKFGKTRTIPFLDSNFMTDLRQFTMGQPGTAPVFNVKARMVQHIVQQAAERADITHPFTGATHVSPHLFRHSIARHLKSAGYQAEFIQKFLGHTSIKTTMDTYGTLSLEEMQQIVVNKTGDSSLRGESRTVHAEIEYREAPR